MADGVTVGDAVAVAVAVASLTAVGGGLVGTIVSVGTAVSVASSIGTAVLSPTIAAAVGVSSAPFPLADWPALQALEKMIRTIKQIDRPLILTKVFIFNAVSTILVVN